MRHVRRLSGVLAVLAIFTAGSIAQKPLSADDKTIISDFEKRAKTYVERRQMYSRGLPKVPDAATPEQIQAHRDALQKAIQAARVNAEQGNVFTQSATALIRAIIKAEFKGYERAELRQTV